MTGEVSENDLDYLLEKSFNENYKKKEKPDLMSQNKCPMNGFNRKYNKTSKRPTRSVKYNHVKDNLGYTRHLLPEGWSRIRHESGMYFYYHNFTGVVTWSMPYKLELEPPVVHRVPIRSIPCLSYLVMKNDGADWDNLVNVKKLDLENNKLVPNSTVSEGDSNKEESQKEKMEPDLEDGEIESSDEEDKNKPNETKEVKRNNHQSNSSSLKRNRSATESQSKTNSIKPQLTPIITSHFNKIPKLSSNCTPNKTNTAPFQSTIITPTKDDKESDKKKSPKVEKIDFTAKFLEPQLFRNYCDRLFTFADEFKYLPIKYFHKKKKPTDACPVASDFNRIEVDQQTSLLTNTSTSTDGKSMQSNSDFKEPPVNVDPPFISPLCANYQIKVPNKNGFIDTRGRNESCILNMYCQHAFGMTPRFIFTNNKTGIHDFTTQCFINDTPYGIGEGKTKKLAKHNCVLKTLEILIPGFSQFYSSNSTQDQSAKAGNSEVNSSQLSLSNQTETSTSLLSATTEEDLFSIFDSMEITDPRVLNYSTRLNTMTPKDIVMECMNRHCIPDHKVESKIEKVDKYNIYKFKVGDREVEVRCMNKREGQQLAAQKMLAEMHPHIQSWGGVMRLYGPGSKPLKRFDMQEMQSLLLEDRGGVKNNLIRLLRRKMTELHEEWHDSKDQSKAKFKVPFENIPVIAFHPDSVDRSQSFGNGNTGSSINNSNPETSRK